LQHCGQEKTLTVSTLFSHYRSDDCECEVKVAELADLLKNIINTPREATNLKAATMSPAPSGLVSHVGRVEENTRKHCHDTRKDIKARTVTERGHEPQQPVNQP
jgi:hypothetical protein